MISTNLGEITIKINGCDFDYTYTKLPKKGMQYEVDGRCCLVVDHIPENEETVIECILQNTMDELINAGPDTGEDLALITFESKNMILSIGVQGDIPGVLYEYLDDRMRIRVTKNASVLKFDVYVAWITMDNIEEQEIYTWFAADPTLR